MSVNGPTSSKAGDAPTDPAADVPGIKWFARYDAASGVVAAGALLDERTSRLTRCIELARAEPTGKRIRKLRVATRRADMAVRFASPIADARDCKRARRALQTLRRAGGAVRRCDVFIERLHETAVAAPGQDISEAAIALIGRLGAERGRAQRGFIESIGCDDAIEALRAIELRQRAELGRETAPEDGPSAEPNAADASAEAPAAARSKAGPSTDALAMAMLRDAGADFSATANAAALDFNALHTFRLRVKRLRYAAESAAPVIGDAAAAALIQSATPLQDELGTINDLAELASELAAFHADMTDLPGVGKLRSGLDRMLLAASSERDRRAVAFGKHRKERIAPVSAAIASLKPRPGLRLASGQSGDQTVRSESA